MNSNFPLPVVVRCVKNRLDWANEIADRLGGVLYLDMAKQPTKAFAGSLFMFAGKGHLNLEDDALLSKEFEPKVLEAVKKYGNNVIRFFPGVSPYTRGEPTIQGGSKFMWTQCTWFPDWFPHEYLDWALKNNFTAHPDDRWGNFDTSVREFLVATKRKFVCWYPLYVQHRLGSSTIGPRSSKRQSLLFYDTLDQVNLQPAKNGLLKAVLKTEDE